MMTVARAVVGRDTENLSPNVQEFNYPAFVETMWICFQVRLLRLNVRFSSWCVNSWRPLVWKNGRNVMQGMAATWYRIKQEEKNRKKKKQQTKQLLSIRLLFQSPYVLRQLYQCDQGRNQRRRPWIGLRLATGLRLRSWEPEDQPDD